MTQLESTRQRLIISAMIRVGMRARATPESVRATVGGPCGARG